MTGKHRLRHPSTPWRYRGLAAVALVVVLVSALVLYVIPWTVTPSAVQAQLALPSTSSTSPSSSASNVPLPSDTQNPSTELADPNDVSIIEIEAKAKTAPKTSTVQPTPKPTVKPSPKPTQVVKATAAPVTSSGKCTGIGVLSNVVAACNQVAAAFPEIKTIGGRASRANASCHPTGQALDLMMSSNALGDRVAAYAQANKGSLGVALILWEVPDHFDHVHLSFAPCKF